MYEVRLVPRDLARPLTDAQGLANRRIASELSSARDCFDAHDAAEVAEILGVDAGEGRTGAPTARSQWMLIERLRDDLERALRRGDVIAEEAPLPSSLSERREPSPELAPPPLPRPRAEPEPALPEPDLPPELVDQEFQAQTLQAAAEQGSPFCEECAKAKRGSDLPGPATHPAPAVPAEGTP